MESTEESYFQQRKIEDYRSTLLQQMAEKKNRKQLLLKEEEARVLKETEELNANYKFGQQTGGGAPVRSLDGKVIT